MQLSMITARTIARAAFAIVAEYRKIAAAQPARRETNCTAARSERAPDPAQPRRPAITGTVPVRAGFRLPADGNPPEDTGPWDD